MDLTQIKRKAEAGKYQDLDSFKGDIHLIADNALEYNPDISSSGKLSVCVLELAMYSYNSVFVYVFV